MFALFVQLSRLQCSARIATGPMFQKSNNATAAEKVNHFDTAFFEHRFPDKWPHILYDTWTLYLECHAKPCPCSRLRKLRPLMFTKLLALDLFLISEVVFAALFLRRPRKWWLSLLPADSGLSSQLLLLLLAFGRSLRRCEKEITSLRVIPTVTLYWNIFVTNSDILSALRSLDFIRIILSSSSLLLVRGPAVTTVIYQAKLIQTDSRYAWFKIISDARASRDA